MLDFKKLQLGDINRIRSYFNFSSGRICDNTVGGAFMWRDYFSVEFAEYNETVIFKARVRYYDDIIAFSIPLGKDVRGSIDRIAGYCRSIGLQIAFFTVTDEDIDLLQTIFTNYSLFKVADWSDYIYRASDMRDLPGRKFHGQRNHINYFKRAFADYVFEEISGENISDVREFLIGLGSRLDASSEILVEDHNKTLEVLDNFETYGLLGGLLRADGSVVAFSVGEIIRNVLYVHVEKADLRFRGAYQVINTEFARRFASEGVDFINREEDVGDGGLRISKNSYHPCEILTKYIFLAH